MKMFDFLSKPSISKEKNSDEIKMKIQTVKSDIINIKDFQEIIEFIMII